MEDGSRERNQWGKTHSGSGMNRVPGGDRRAPVLRLCGTGPRVRHLDPGHQGKNSPSPYEPLLCDLELRIGILALSSTV